MATLAIDQDQGVIGSEAAQIRRARERRRVADGLDVDVERRHYVAQQVGEIRTPLVVDIAVANHVDGHHRFGHRTRLCTTTDHSQSFEENSRFAHGHIKPGCFPIHNGYFHRYRLEPEKAKLHHMGSCRHLLDHIVTINVGNVTDGQCRNGHLYLGQRHAVFITHGPFKGALRQNRHGDKRQKYQGC